MRTKIIATMGPSCSDKEVLKQMVEYGVRVFRHNFSHADATELAPRLKSIRELENELNIPLTVMGDLSGPKVRIGNVKGSPLQVFRDTTVRLGPPDMDTGADDPIYISLDFPELLKGLEVGMPVSLSDGMLQFTVTKVLKTDQLFEMTSINNGILTSHKGIAFPGKFHPMPAMTDKDRKDLHEGLDVGMDAAALSFVQTQDDVLDLRGEIQKHGTWIPIVAKLERNNALDNLDAILAATDIVMVARGDLGLECPLVHLPVIQKRIIRAARHAQKGAIVATQMLLSMVKNPLPTRAETTDVANAVMDGADCVMLSEETAIGQYPVEVVKMINGIASHAEEYYLERIEGPFRPKKEKNPVKYLAYSACLLAESMSSAGLVCHSTSGGTARLLSSRRPRQYIYALTPDERVIRALNFNYGVKPCLADDSIYNHLDRVEKFIEESDEFASGDNLVLTSGQPTPGQQESHTNALKLYYK
ncbi:MAG: pyruvate kinase [Desulfovibrio sp.]|nr:MAG: pyruvate kinase [Desulfovibrio sp.]